MRELNHTELNSVNGAWSIPAVAAYLPSMESVVAAATSFQGTVVNYVAALPPLPQNIAGHLPAIVATHPYAAAVIGVGAAYLAYRSLA